MKAVHVIAWILLVIGGLNWGLTAFGVNVVGMLPEMLAKIIYVLVGISAIVSIFTHKKDCKCCTTSASAPAQTM